MLADPAATLHQLAAFVGVELSTHLEDDTLTLIITNPNPNLTLTLTRCGAERAPRG